MKTIDIAKFLSAELVGDPDVEITSVADVEHATETQLAFADKTEAVVDSSAGCLIVPFGLDVESSTPFVRVRDPKLAFALVAGVLHPAKRRAAEIHPSAVISPSARIGENVFVGAFVCVGDGSSIGDGTQLRAGAKVGDNVAVGKNCVLDPNVFVEDNCTVGDNVILHTGVVIGTDGFGFVRRGLDDDERTTPSDEAAATPPLKGGELIKFPQIGTVVIEDNVEIGANSCVDRGALGETRIGEGTKIDNLVQIAHNVQIGKRVVIAAQTGISGSTVIEDDCVIGGQVGMGDHARVLSGAIIGSQAGVLPGKIVRPGIWWGTPVQPLDEYKRQNAMVKGLGRLRDDVNKLKKAVENSATEEDQ